MAGPSSIKEKKLLTRCSPKQFVELAKHVRTDERLKDKFRDIGFDKILEMTCTKLPHAVCEKLITAIDPETCSICIRNCKRQISGNDVEMLMGIPNKGNDVVEEDNIESELFAKLKKFRNDRFSIIKKMIISEEGEEMLELMIVLYTLGTLLCPTTSGGITDRLLKIVCCKKEKLASYNWCNFVVKELMSTRRKRKE